MNEQDMNTDTAAAARDVFAEIAGIAVGAAFADTAARRLAAGDIAHALGAAYPELAVGALRRKPAPRLRWEQKKCGTVLCMRAVAPSGEEVAALICNLGGEMGWQVRLYRADTFIVLANATKIRSLKLARLVARGMVKGVFGWACRRARRRAANGEEAR